MRLQEFSTNALSSFIFLKGVSALSRITLGLKLMSRTLAFQARFFATA